MAYNLLNTEREGYYTIKNSAEKAIKKGYTVIGLSSSAQGETEAFVRDFKLPFKFYFTDETVLKTIIRANPGIVSLNKGTIVQKLHYNDASDLILKDLPSAQPELDFELKRELDSIAVLDQRYRKLMMVQDPTERAALGKEMGLGPEDYEGNLWERQLVLDTSNLRRIEYILQNSGYPGKTRVGEPTNTAAWYVVQHNPEKIPTYLDMMKEAGRNGEIPFSLVAMMEDRYLMNEGKPQVYGTQGMTYGDAPSFIWPIQNPESVNKRREEAGFTQSIEEYSKMLFGESFTYKEISLKEAQDRKTASTQSN